MKSPWNFVHEVARAISNRLGEDEFQVVSVYVDKLEVRALKTRDENDYFRIKPKEKTYRQV